MQPVRPFATEYAKRQVDRHIVAMVPLDTQVPDPNLGLHSPRHIDDDHPTSRWRWLDGRRRRNLRARPAAERTLGRSERFLRRDITDDPENHVVRNEVGLVVRLQILTGDLGQ